MKNDECLPYEKEAILELTTFIDEGEGVDLDSILDYAYYLCKDD